MIIAVMVIAYVFSLFCWITWDSYMKLTNKPLIKSKIVRFVFVHCGSHNENEITVNDGKVSLPCDKNRDSISKTVMAAQIICFAYAVVVIVLDVICLATKNNVLYYVTVPLASIYIIFAVIALFIGEKKHAKVFSRQSFEKYEAVVKEGQKNNITVEDAAERVLKGGKINFKLYRLEFEFSIYKEDKVKGNILQLLDLTHGKILNVKRSFNELIEGTFINFRSFKELWDYFELSVLND